MTRDVPKLLELADERVARCDGILRKQRELIDGLRSLGLDTAASHNALLEFGRVRARYIEARDRLREELEQGGVPQQSSPWGSA